MNSTNPANPASPSYPKVITTNDGTISNDNSCTHENIAGDDYYQHCEVDYEKENEEDITTLIIIIILIGSIIVYYSIKCLKEALNEEEKE